VPQPKEEAPPVEQEDTVDGEPMDEDLDGEPLSDIDGDPLTDEEEEEDEVAEQDMQEPQEQEIDDMFA
jgi:U2-associated protein SR140